MARKKGDGLGRIGGRKKGTPNKVNADLKHTIKMFCEDKMSEVDEIWEKLPPSQKTLFLTNLLPYVTPKMASVDVTDDKRDAIDDIKERINKLTQQI